MTDPFWALLAVLTWLQVKHFLCDYPFQSLYQLQNKGKYGHPGGLIHSGLHALFTLPAFLIVTPTLAVGALIIVGEFVVHYHTDWAKSQINDRFHLTPNQAQFWWAIGFDQFVHQMTYVAVAGVLVGATLGT